MLATISNKHSSAACPGRISDLIPGWASSVQPASECRVSGMEAPETVKEEFLAGYLDSLDYPLAFLLDHRLQKIATDAEGNIALRDRQLRAMRRY
jgi:hypothetical protein